MKISGFVEYVKQIWKNKPDTSTPVSAERLNHIEEGIKANSDALAALAAVVCDQVLNDPEKIASLAALYSVDKKIGNTANLPNSAADVVTALTTLNSKFVNGRPSGNTLEEMLVNAKLDVTYRWADYNSAAYSPTRKNGVWQYELYNPVSSSVYAHVIAFNTADGSRYIYGANARKWFSYPVDKFGGIQIYTSANIADLGVNLTDFTTSQIYAAMPANSISIFYFEPNSALATEFSISNGGTVALYKYNNWRGLAYASLVATNPIRLGGIAGDTINWRTPSLS